MRNGDTPAGVKINLSRRFLNRTVDFYEWSPSGIQSKIETFTIMVMISNSWDLGVSSAKQLLYWFL